MLRYVLILGLLILLYFLLRSAIKEFRAQRAGVPSRDQMVQDPMCRVYLPRGTAVEATIGGQQYYFCSRDCAGKFEARLSG